MPGTVNRPGKLLQVRSSTLVGYSGPDVTTAPGTSDPIPVSSAGSDADRMPQAKGFLNIPGGTGAPRIVSEHLSWQALQGEPGDSGALAGAGGSIGEPQHMPGVVQQNKPPF